jgi:hypothetical protein
MTTDAESKVMTLKERLDHGEYKVDTKKVADAIVRNPLWIMLLVGSSSSSSGSRQAATG